MSNYRLNNYIVYFSSDIIVMLVLLNTIDISFSEKLLLKTFNDINQNKIITDKNIAEAR